jgi:glycosyltransferase involved in cell wall biosynthesis
VLGDAYVIGNWFWELPELPEPWTNDLVLYDEIWSPTRFVQAAVSAKASCPVILIPPVVEMELSGSFPRSHFGLPERRFLFLAMADTRSVLERKNPLGVLRAFKQAFGTDDPTVALVLKLNNPDWGQGLLRALKLEAEGCSNVFMVERTLSRPELNGLIASADCFVSLHRSEGFGLGPAEAMYLGKPAIVTNWSGNVDYMADGNSVAIDYQLVPVGEEVGIYGGGQKWAEPDIDQAAHWMRRLRDEPALAEAIGLRGQETIRTNFSRQHVGSLIAARLSAIRR